MADTSETARREEEILTFWQKEKVFEKSLEKDSPEGEFVFYEGPPTANGLPGIHHLESRAFKDAIPRYKTMQGYHVRRKAGWDTHGLPVELAVEKELGLKTKKDVEAYGIEKFNKKCKESVLRYIDEWKKFSARIGFWVDHEDTYFTFTTDYIESLWHIVKHIWDKKLLYKDYKVVPWCPRCGTVLSSHELAQEDGYQDVSDPSVYVKFKSVDADEHFLAWTTTPWTLIGNIALAVGEDISYVKAEVSGEKMWFAKDRLGDVSSEAKILEEAKGKELVGKKYEPLFNYLKESLPESEKEKLPKAYTVYAADFVSTEDGTGIVHTAVMYGQDDFELGSSLGLPKYHLVNEDGNFSDDVKEFAKTFVKDADKNIIKDLKKRNLLLREEEIVHSYPHCWRCKTPLIYYARDSWYIRMSELREELIQENQKIHWEPKYIRDGRFGEWLRELKDWAISRSRYWGTPLPIWMNEKTGEMIVVGSIAELRELATTELPEELDLHKPYIDDIKLKGKDGAELARVPEVMDVWFDSGAMPFAQDHYPFENKEWVDTEGYPADFISEAIDQTRGWFYTLHAVGGLMGRGLAYKNVISLGHILDKNGRKMSKSLGNVVDPWEMIEKYGVDALRLWMYTVNSAGDSKNFDEQTVDEIVKKHINRLVNVYSFYELYKDSVEHDPSEKSGNVLDQWIVARENELHREVTKLVDAYQLDRAARLVVDFVDDLSTWYIRRSRNRFKGDDTEDKKRALATTRWVLRKYAKAVAPFAPFIAEWLWQRVQRDNDPESVHLANWCTAREPDTEILATMKQVREGVSRALEERASAGIKVRQPLKELRVKGLELQGKEEFLNLMRDEVNVKEVVIDPSLQEEVVLDTEITPELKEEGNARDLIRHIQDARKKTGLTPNDMATLSVQTNEQGRKLIEKFRDTISTTALLKDIIFHDTAGKKVTVDGISFAVSVSA